MDDNVLQGLGNQELMQQFKEMISPDNEKNYDKLNQEWISLCRLLYERGIIIEQFPTILKAPPALKAFAYSTIRTRIQQETNSTESVPWAQRRLFIEKLIFKTSDEFEPAESYQINKAKETILEEIMKARHSIWAVSPWFDEPEIINALKERHEDGIQIRIIISNEGKTSEEMLKKVLGSAVIVHPRFGYKDFSRVHSKYWIFDAFTTIQGSANITKSALNYENFEQNSLQRNREIALDLADDYREIFKSYKAKLKRSSTIVNPY